MAPRKDVVAQSITHSITRHKTRRDCFARFSAIFYAYWLNFDTVRSDVFQTLRQAWNISDEQFRACFQHPLLPLGDMGYSGSTFFCTYDTKYVIKSVPRRFEHSFFRDDLLLPYADHMATNHRSLLVRITSFLQGTHCSVGTLLGTAPSHHIIMENIKHDASAVSTDNADRGGGSNSRREGGEDGDEDASKQWKTFDLKPVSYFYPERDVAGGALASEATKSRLADSFEGKIGLTLDQVEDFKMQLAKDTQLLAKCNAVDYSLCLVKVPANTLAQNTSKTHEQYEESWRTGVKTVDGQYLYRAAILDFFWAKHKTFPTLMTGLIRSYNVIDRQGPMSVTTTAPEYRERFLKMCHEIIEVAQT